MAVIATPAAPTAECRISIERLRLVRFRNYRSLDLTLRPAPVVLTGANGAGKTNLLEAVSLLSAGHGLRQARYEEMGHFGGIAGVVGGGGVAEGWSVSALLRHLSGSSQIGTGPGRAASSEEGGRGASRLIRIDGVNRNAAALAELVEVMWLTPAMDGLFIGPAADRRRFLDRLIQCFDPAYRTRLNQFEKALRQRNRLLEHDNARAAELAAIETIAAELGVAIAAARVEAVADLVRTIEMLRQADPQSPFPWAKIALAGSLEERLATMPAVEVEDSYRDELAAMRQQDRAAGRTLAGPHRSDLVVHHGPKSMPAALSSTGEQKALLVNLVLAHAEHVKRLKQAGSPILLFDEIAAHLDAERRTALFATIAGLGSQVFLTGTDRAPFEALESRAQYLRIDDGIVSVEPRNML